MSWCGCPLTRPLSTVEFRIEPWFIRKIRHEMSHVTCLWPVIHDEILVSFGTSRSQAVEGRTQWPVYGSNRGSFARSVCVDGFKVSVVFKFTFEPRLRCCFLLCHGFGCLRVHLPAAGSGDARNSALLTIKTTPPHPGHHLSAPQPEIEFCTMHPSWLRFQTGQIWKRRSLQQVRAQVHGLWRMTFLLTCVRPGRVSCGIIWDIIIET